MALIQETTLCYTEGARIRFEPPGRFCFTGSTNTLIVYMDKLLISVEMVFVDRLSIFLLKLMMRSASYDDQTVCMASLSVLLLLQTEYEGR